MTLEDWFIIAGPAIAAGWLIATLHVPLGIEVLKRGIVFIDLAVAQIVGLGLVIASVLFHHLHPLVLQAVALGCALSSGLLFRKLEQVLPNRQEAVIGVVYVLSASLSVLVLSGHPHGGEEIQNLLSGEILFVGWSTIAWLAPYYLALLAMWLWKPQWQKGLGFYVFFALAVTPAVQFAGVFLVFASLILPALVHEWSAAKTPALAWVASAVAVLTGLVVSTATDLPAGPLLVVTYSAVAIAVFVWAKCYCGRGSSALL